VYEWDMKREGVEIKNKLCLNASVYLLINCAFSSLLIIILSKFIVAMAFPCGFYQ